mmetsp:Transcript_12588/g.25551  ORF Transcript_12588/g.25551 Transcript_12588/m.25551 type:complete len:309 (-) Transcript_12588:2703-3629(-)
MCCSGGGRLVPIPPTMHGEGGWCRFSTCGRPRGRPRGSPHREENLTSPISSPLSRVSMMLLGGGLPLGETTEFCGPPGVGKSQFAFSFAVNARVPKVFGGLGAQVVFMDTEGSFVVERIVEIAEAMVRHIHRMANSGDPTSPRTSKMKTSAETFSVESILGGIHIFRVLDQVEQLALSITLDSFLSDHPDVRLIIVDSVAFHFRQGFSHAETARALAAFAQRMTNMAVERDLAVLYINQVTTRLSEADSDSYLVPALGDTWSHVAAQRVLLYWDHDLRFAKVVKSHSQPENHIQYLVTPAGIRGIPDS